MLIKVYISLKNSVALFSYSFFYFLQSFQAQLVELLPPSPHRMPRGQHRGDDPGNMQVQCNPIPP